MIKIFTGFDARESQGFLVFVQSLLKVSPDPVAIIPISGLQNGEATNAFTHIRFMVPEFCGWGGRALWMDGSDMLLREDPIHLLKLFDKSKAIQVVKHDYQTRHGRKYIGTSMEALNADYPRKNWSSVILWNCGHMAHFRNRERIRQAIAEGDGKFLHRFGWLEDAEIGDLPAEWNWLPQEAGDNEEAKLIHYTLGGPFFPHYRDTEMSGHWHEVAKTLHSER